MAISTSTVLDNIVTQIPPSSNRSTQLLLQGEDQQVNVQRIKKTADHMLYKKQDQFLGQTLIPLALRLKIPIMSSIWAVMWDALPPGFRFHPTDEEFVNHYLTNYILGKRVDMDIIPVVEDLFKRDPSKLPHLFRGSSIIRSRDPEWWFLSTLKYKSPNSDKFDRSTSMGSWKITGKPKEIYHRGSKRPIAVMRNLVFCENPRNKETNWVMHEYHLSDTSFRLCLREQRMYVLCHLVNRQYDYAETSTNMEVDLNLEELPHSFSEEIIQAKMRSLTEGPWSPATNASPHNPRYSPESILCIDEIDPVGYLDETELAMSMSGGDEDDIVDLLNHAVFSTDEESAHSSQFEVASVYELFLEHENTLQTASKNAVLWENRQTRPPGTLEGYVVIDETRGFMEDDFQREAASDASSLPDSPQNPPTKCPSGEDAWLNPTASLSDVQRVAFGGSDHRSTPVIERQQTAPPGGYHNIKEAKGNSPKVTVRQSAANDPRSLTLEVRRNPSTRAQTSRSREGNEKMPFASCAGDGCRPLFVYLVNLGAGIVLLVLMMLWLLMH